MIDKKPPKTRAYDAVVGTAIAAVVIAAATFGEFGPTRHAAPTVVMSAMQAPRPTAKAKNLHPKPHCYSGRDCRH